MPFSETLEKAFKYPWKNRALWFYGLLIAIFAGGSGVSNSFDSKDLERVQSQINLSQETIVQLLSVGVILLLIFSIASIIITSWSQAAIAKGAKAVEEGKEVNRKEIGKTGKRNVWRLIVLNVFIPLGIFLLFMLVLAPIVILLVRLPQQTALIAGGIFLILLILAIIPVLVYFGVIWNLAGRAVVLEDQKPISAIKDSRSLLKGHFWETFLFFLLLGLIVGLGSLIFILPLIAIALVMFAAYAANIMAGVVIGAIIAIAYLIFYLLASGYFQAASQTGITLWWLELKKTVGSLK